MKYSRKLQLLVLFFALLVVFFIRAYSFETNIQFDSDSGRDALFALRILQGNPTLLGPAASVGGFYLGPLLYYFVAVILLATNLNPLAINFVYICMGVATVIVGAWLQMLYVSKYASKIFFLLAATSAPLVMASQSATNQPMMPLVAVIFLFVYLAGIKRNALRFDFITGLVFGLFLHIHFSAFLIFIPLVPLFFWQAQGAVKRKFLHLCLFGLGVLAMAAPLVLFDIRHNFITTRSLFGYALATITGSSLDVARPHLSNLEKIKLVSDFLTPEVGLTLICLLIGVAAWVWKKKALTSQYVQTLLALSFGSLILIFMYQGYLFAYYLLVPATIWLLLFATLIAHIQPKFLGFALAVLICLLSFSRLNYNEKFRTIKNLSQITAVIEQDIKKTKPEKFTVFKDSSDQMTGLGYEYRFLLARNGFMPHSEYAYNEADVLYYIREEGASDPLISTHWETTEFAATKSELLADPKVHNNIISIFRLTR